MEVSWYCWVTVMSLVTTNFHGCRSWPTLQPPLQTLTSTHELDSDESRKVLGSSVVTSVSVIMDHGNGTKTLLSDSVDAKPEVKSNSVPSPGNLLNPDRYEFYTFDEAGDLVKRLMTWDEIQGLIAGGDGDSLLGEASVPMFYSDSLTDKAGSTHIAASDFQTSDIQGVHKVVESVQNVLKSELAASQSKIPPVAKPTLLSQSPNWSLFLPTLLDNAEDGSEINNLALLANAMAPNNTAAATNVVNLEANATTTEQSLTTVREDSKKTKKPLRTKPTASKPIEPVRGTSLSPSSFASTTINTSSPSTSHSGLSYFPLSTPTFSSFPSTSLSTSSFPSTTHPNPFLFKKTYSTSKYGVFPTSDSWSTMSTTKKTYVTNNKWDSSSLSNELATISSTIPSSTVKKVFLTSKYGDDLTTSSPFISTSKKFFSTSKYGGYVTNDELNSSPARRNTTTKYGGFSSVHEHGVTDYPLTRKPLTTSKYPSVTTNHELYASLSSMLQHVSSDLKTSTTNAFPLKNKTETKVSFLETGSTQSVISLNQFKTSTEKLYPQSLVTEMTSYHHGNYSFKTGSTDKKVPSTPSSFTSPYKLASRIPSTESSKIIIDPHRTSSASQTTHKLSLYSNKPVLTIDRQPPPSFSSFLSGGLSTTTGAFAQKLSSLTGENYSSRKPVYSTFESSTKKVTASEISTSQYPFPGNLRNSTLLSNSYFPSVSTTTANILKTTKTYESPTPPTSFLAGQKQNTGITSTRPFSMTKPTYTRITSKPTDFYSRPLSLSSSTSSSSVTTEKPLIRISTLKSTTAEVTTVKPEPLVTWISTSPLEDTPSKVSLFGVYDTDKLVTEQYVSSSNIYNPPVNDFFRSSVASSSTTHSSSSMSVSEHTESPFRTFSTPVRSSVDFASHSETTYPSTKYSSLGTSSLSEDRSKVSVSEKPSEKYPEKLSTQSQSYNHSEMVMQRVPTINPPNKSNTAATAVKSSTHPQFIFTDSMKNITQIAVMLNKLNESGIKGTSIKNEYRNKVTRPMFETMKPTSAPQFNDCVTSLIFSSMKENLSTEGIPLESRLPYHKIPINEQKDNSPIYYYKLPPVTSVADFTNDILKYKEVSDFTLKSTTEKEYLKITTVNRPDDVVQEGISAVTNILLQTEGRVPNKQPIESDGNVTQTYSTTEAIMRTDDIELAKNSSTKTAELEGSSSPSSVTYTSVIFKRQNVTTESPTYIQLTTVEPIGSTSLETETEKSFNGSSVDPVTTTEAITEVESVTLISTTLAPDFRNELIDNRNSSEVEDNAESSENLALTRTNIPPKGTSTPTSTTLTSSTFISNYSSTISSTVTTVLSSTTQSRSTGQPVSVKSTTEKGDVKTSTVSGNRVVSTPSNIVVEYVEVKLENKTKNESNTESQDSLAPPSAFRSPSNPTHRLPSSTTSPQVDLHPAPHESMGLEASIAYLGDDVKRFVDFCNELSFKIWTTQTGKSSMTSRSIVLSPFAVISTLAMIFLGARGSSSGIMNDFLKLDDMVTFNPHQVLQNITESATNPKNIGVANAALVREIFSDKSKGKVLDFYKERLQQYYDTHVEEVNFNSIGDLVRRRTNLLVKRQTQGRIQDYLKGTALSLKPPLAVFTSNLFQTDCELASTDGRDGEMYFVVRPSTRQRRLVPIPAVVYRSGFLAGYEPSLDATAVTLNPESVVSTILVLPGQQGQVAPGDGLARLEQRLLESSYRRGSWSRLLRSLLFRPGLELQIPRFSHKSVLNLTAGLQKMGMEEIFSADRADLRGINGLSNELHLSDVVQVNTFSTCGDTAVGSRHHTEVHPASPQRVGRTSDIFDRTFLDDSVSKYYSSLPLNLRPRQARLPDNPRLRFDRPFLYVVRHNPTGMIIFIGRFNPRLLP